MKAMDLDLSRQGELVPGKLLVKDIVVVGCGTTGSWVAHALLRMGFRNVRVCDPDGVEPHNSPAQFHERKKGGPKVASFGRAMRVLGLPEPKKVAAERFENINFRSFQKIGRETTVFSCVDSVEARKAIGRMAREKQVAQLVDLRMGPQTGSSLFVGPMTWEEYEAGLEKEFVAEPACGARAVLTLALALVGTTLEHWRRAQLEQVRPRKRFDMEPGLLRAFEEV